MQSFEKIKKYSKAVCDEIKWKKAHAIITEEIENHLIDQRDAYIDDGADEATATDKSIAQMGDPAIVGTQLDRTHRPKPQWSMIILTAVLVSIGFFIKIFTISSNDHWLAETLASTFIGLGLMSAAYFMDFTFIGKHPKTIYFSMLVLSVAALLFSPVINGRSFYAALLPLLFPLGFAAIVYATRNKGYGGIILCGLSFLLPAGVALFTPSTSGFILFAISGLVIVCIAISKRWFNVKVLNGYLLVFIPVAIVILLAVLGIYGSYRWDRLQFMFNPSIDPNGAGYIATQVQALLGGSNLFGQGSIPGAMSGVSWLGNSKDYLLTHLIFHVGWVAFFVIIGLLLFFIVKGFILCFKQKSSLALYVSVAVMMTFTMQVIVYVIVNLGLQLVDPISLPLLSYGNVATIINLTLIGIMLSVFRTGDIVKDRNTKPIKNHHFICYNDGKLIISLSKK